MLTVHTTAAGDIIHNITMRQRVGVQGFGGVVKKVTAVIENSYSEFSLLTDVSKKSQAKLSNPT